MPKSTFYKLTTEKQMTICQSALEEFSTYDYAEASINRIIKQAKISRGSFYTYFDDKNDLYIYCMTTCLFNDKIDAKGNFYDFIVRVFDVLMTNGQKYPEFMEKVLLASTQKQQMALWKTINLTKSEQLRQGFRFKAEKDLQIIWSLCQTIIWQSLTAYFIAHHSYQESKDLLLRQLLFLKIGIQG